MVALVIVFKLLRPAVTAMFAPPPPPPTPEPGAALNEVVGDTPALPGPSDEERLAVENAAIAVQLEGARSMAKQNPAAVAQIVRDWVNGEPA